MRKSAASSITKKVTNKFKMHFKHCVLRIPYVYSEEFSDLYADNAVAKWSIHCHNTQNFELGVLVLYCIEIIVKNITSKQRFKR